MGNEKVFYPYCNKELTAVFNSRGIHKHMIHCAERKKYTRYRPPKSKKGRPKIHRKCGRPAK